jgi:hypothetical protein
MSCDHKFDYWQMTSSKVSRIVIDTSARYNFKGQYYRNQYNHTEFNAQERNKSLLWNIASLETG